MVVHRLDVGQRRPLGIGEHAAVHGNQREAGLGVLTHTAQSPLQRLAWPRLHLLRQLALQKMGGVAQPAIDLVNNSVLKMVGKDYANHNDRHQRQTGAG